MLLCGVMNCVPALIPALVPALANRVPYGLEVLKHGTLLGSQELNTQAFYTFGRSPTADVLLEHPTASRLHAVLQVGRRRLAIPRPHTVLQATHGLHKASILLHVYSMLAVQLHL